MENDKIAAYWDKGFLVLRTVLDEKEIRALRAECERLAVQTGRFDTFVEPRKNLDGTIVRERLEALSDYSPVFKKLARDKRLLSIIRQIFRAKAFLFKDKIHLRPPGTIGFRLHQDYTAYAFAGIPPSDLVTIMIAIDPVTKASGPLEVFPDYHHEVLPEPDNDQRAADQDSVEPGSGELVELDPGDLCAFHSLTPHRSSPNISNHPRRTVFLTYNHSQHGDCYRAYYAGRENIYR